MKIELKNLLIYQFDNMNVVRALNILENYAPNPSGGLPDEIFLYISKTTPLVNVDLLIKNTYDETLLSWRNDEYSEPGWHIPGGIVRYKETLENRVLKVAELEIHHPLEFDINPIAIHQLIETKRNIRGHFISILYNCKITNTFIPKNDGLISTDSGYLKWHKKCPDNLIPCHEIYRKLIDG